MSKEDQERLEQVAINHESDAEFAQMEADDARWRAEGAWQEYYAYDPGEEEEE